MLDTLPIHPRLLHPLTREPIQAIGLRKDGTPIWPIMGGDDTVDPVETETETPPADGVTPPANKAPADGQAAKQQPAEDVKDLPQWAQDRIKNLGSEAAKDRTTAKSKAADEARQQLAQDIGKALGLVKDDAPADPAKLAAQVQTLTEESRQARVELAVFKAAAKAQADPAKLTDSRSFMDKVAKLDPAADGFGKKVSDAIKAAVDDDPGLKAGPALPSKSSPNMPNGNKTGRATTLADAVSAAYQ